MFAKSPPLDARVKKNLLEASEVTSSGQSLCSSDPFLALLRPQSRLESALLLRLPHATVTCFALYCYPAWQEERPLAHKPCWKWESCLAVGEAAWNFTKLTPACLQWSSNAHWSLPYVKREQHMTHVVSKEMRLTKQIGHFLISLLLLISTLWGPGLGVYLQRPNMAIWWDVNFGILSHLASFYCRKSICRPA